MDIKHHYTDSGCGEPLILLHGNGEDSSYFDAQIKEFSSCCRVIAVDTRGHGQTPRGSTPFTIRQFAGDLAGFMDSLDIQRANILGFSDGANIAMCFAAANPQRVIRLILNGGNLDPSGILPFYQIPIEIWSNILSPFSHLNPKDRRRAELLDLMTRQPDITPDELAHITADTLVIAGTRDMVKPSHTKLIASSIPNSKLVFIEGDHFIARKNPAAYNKAVAEFLQQK